MRKTLLAIALLFAVHSAFGGIEYEFVQRTQSDIEQIPASDVTGKAVIDGSRSRVDFTGGARPPYPIGAYVISLDGSRTLTWVDPLSKSYTEMSASAIATSIGGRNIKIDNLKHNVQKLAETTKIAGIPTEHYHLTITYEMTVAYGAMPLKQSVREEIDKWVTLQFGDVAEIFLAAGNLRTGNPGLDALMDAETTSIKGFPLQQTVKITTSTESTVPGSKLATEGGFRPVRTQSRDLTVTSIRLRDIDASTFAVPATYKKADSNPQLDKTKQTDVTILSFDPK